MEISEQVFAFMELEEFAADFHSNNFFISERGFEAAASEIERGNYDRVMLDYQAVNGDDKGIPGLHP
jgi:hypothetical protein